MHNLNLVLAIIITLVLTASTLDAKSATINECDQIVGRIKTKISKLEELDKNTSIYYRKINNVLTNDNCDINDIRELESIEENIDKLLEKYEYQYNKYIIEKYVKLTIVIIIPIITFIIIKKIYPYLWYYTRRNWLVEGATGK